jgi:hypothetical protein
MQTNGKKYIHISQHWSSRKGGYDAQGNLDIKNPITDEGKKEPSNLKDIETLIEFHAWHEGVHYKFSDNSSPSWGNLSYEIHHDGTLTFVASDCDSSD